MDKAHDEKQVLAEVALAEIPKLWGRGQDGAVLVSDPRGKALVLRLRLLRARVKDVKEISKGILKELEGEEARLVGFYGEALKTWSRALLPEGKRSVQLLEGKVSFHAAGKGVVVVKDSKALSAWSAKDDNPNFNRYSVSFGSLTKEQYDLLIENIPEALMGDVHFDHEPNKVLIADYIKLTGEEPEGVTIEKEESWKVS